VAKFAWAIICQRALLDQTGNVSLIQILEDFGIPAPPPDKPAPIGALVPFSLAIVTYWKRAHKNKPEKHKARLRLLSPAGKQFGSATFDVDLMQHQRARCIAEIPGIAYHGPGAYVVRVDAAAGSRWRSVGETEFNVHHNMALAPTPARLAH